LDALNLGKISVGPPYFEAVFVPLMVPVVFLMVIGPFVRWKNDHLARFMRRLVPAIAASSVIGFGVAYAVDHVTWRTVLGLALAAWVLIGSVQLFVTRLAERPGAAMAARLRGIPAAWWGMWAAHLGVGIFIIGVTMIGSLESSLAVRMQDGQTARLAGYTFTFRGVETVQGPNYQAARATLELSRGERRLTTLHPEKRAYVAHQMPMTQVALHVRPLRDVYVSIGDQLDADSWLVNLHHKPFISWIWAGCVLMALGGILAATDRRYRRLAERSAPAAAAARQPA
ncbi:MAG TPA: cytochrome c-type biogenesis CcmF C-terminal domain-containing protein, partial [Rhodocyclaceae bacterium]|nr:cytochrome c-type biogenesis CcmF C-terminal domain-containing protein [Rhodocyclaceae bacterium]